MTVTTVRLGGRPDRPVLVLGPSLGTSATALWGEAARSLADDFQVIGWDLPGHGHNRAPVEGATTVSALARDVLEAIDRLHDGFEPLAFHYAGDSIGGAVGLQLSLDAPDQVLSATICCSAAYFGGPAPWRERIDEVRSSGTAALGARSSQRWFGSGFADRNPERVSALLQALSDVDDAGYAAVCGALGDFDLRDRLPEIVTRVLTVAGSEDVPCPPEALALIADTVQHGRAVVLPGVAHLAPIEAPEEVAGLIREHALEPDAATDDTAPLYLDHNATTPVEPAVVEAMLPHLTEHFGNPSSSHASGVHARQALDEARHHVRTLLSAAPQDRIVFTGSGSEANALAIRGAVLARLPRQGRAHVITQATEHPSVLAACAELAQMHGVEVTTLPVDEAGRVDPHDVASAITEATVLVTVMLANNETGTVQPVGEIARLAHQHRVLVHTDAAQAIGKVPVDVGELGVDLLTVVGHKMYAPKGIAALHVADGVELRPLIGGGGQESGLRAGTENVPYAVALGAAARLAHHALRDGEHDRLRDLRDLLARRLEELLPDRVHLNGHPTERLPNTLNVSIDGVRALTLLESLPTVVASAGSACHAGQDTPSPVLHAMGQPADRALSAVRLSVGRHTTRADIERAAAAIAGACTSTSAHPAPRN